MRRTSIGAAGIAAVAALALLAGNAAGASVRPVAPEAGAEVYPPARGSTVVLRWQTDIYGCATPLSQTVTVTPLSGQSIINLIGPPPGPTTVNGRQAIRIQGAVTRQQSYAWTVTLVCAGVGPFTARRILHLRPPGPKLQGTYFFPGDSLFTNWGAMTICRGINCNARVNSGVPLRLRSMGNVSPVIYRGGGTRRFTCRDAKGNQVRRGIRVTDTLEVRVLSTIIRNRMTIARRIMVQGRSTETPTTGNRTGNCSRVVLRVNAIGTRR